MFYLFFYHSTCRTSVPDLHRPCRAARESSAQSWCPISILRKRRTCRESPEKKEFEFRGLFDFPGSIRGFKNNGGEIMHWLELCWRNLRTAPPKWWGWRDSPPTFRTRIPPRPPRTGGCWPSRAYRILERAMLNDASYRRILSVFRFILRTLYFLRHPI